MSQLPALVKERGEEEKGFARPCRDVLRPCRRLVHELLYVESEDWNRWKERRKKCR